MNYRDFPEIPKLIDQHTGTYIYETLRRCHDNRVHTYSWLFNIVVIGTFIVIAVVVLYLCFQRNGPHNKNVIKQFAIK